ncbi:MAG: hypothetical protein V7L25_33450 [Nostoc sp.]
MSLCTEKEIKRERSPFEVTICRRSLLKFELQLLCGINYWLQLGKDLYK